ncbi:class I SAM-dependent methyltransferase [Candidatus Altiarchaeota archaeon]
MDEKEFYDRMAVEHGESWWGHTTFAGRFRLKEKAKKVHAIIDGYDRPRVLELGCGTGPYTEFLYRKGMDLTCVDVSPDSIKVFAERFKDKGIHSEVQDITRLSYPDGSFDLVIGNSILHHVDAQQALMEAFRVLRRGGQILFFEPNTLNPYIFLTRHFSFFGDLDQKSPGEVSFLKGEAERMMIGAGFTDVSVVNYDFVTPFNPRALIGFAKAVSNIMERLPLVKEFSGSLSMSGIKTHG